MAKKGKYQTAYEAQFGGGSKQLEKNQRTIANYNARLAAGGVDPEKATDNRNFLEKALNLKQDQNFIFDIFELLNRPQQALFGGIESLQQGGDFLEGAGKGITGNKDTQFKDILMNTGMFDDTKGKLDLVDALGFAGDVFLDPTNIPIIPGLKAGGKLASVDDLIGMGAKKAIKGTVKGADKLIEKGLAKADAIKGVTDNLDNVVKLGYANEVADRASDLQKYVKNAGELAGTGANVPIGRLEAYKTLKNNLTDMFRVSDNAKQAILKGREASVAAEDYRRLAASEIGKSKSKVDKAAKALNMSSEDLSKGLTLFAESKANRDMTLENLLKVAKSGNLDANETTINALKKLTEDFNPKDLDALNLTIDTTKAGKIKLGKGWDNKYLKEAGMEGFNPDKLKEIVNLGENYTDIAKGEIDKWNKLYESNKVFKDVADDVVGDIWNGGKKTGLVDRLNKIIDEGNFGTDLTGKYTPKDNVGYVPHIRNFSFDDIKDFTTVPEGMLKGNSNVLSERNLLGSTREINDMWEASISKGYDTMSDAQKKFVDNHRKLFEDDYLKAVENRYFEQLPNTVKQNKIVNDVLIDQTFGNKDMLENVKKLQSDIHKASLSGNKEALKTATEQYNKLTKDLNIKFLTKYDSKIPTGYTKIEGKTLENMTKHFKEMGSQLGNSQQLDDLVKYISKQKGGVAIDNNILRMMQVSADKKNMNALSRLYDGWLNHFKKWKTASPSFLMNNLVGNTSNLYLSGINPTEIAKYGTEAADIITNGEKYANILLDGGKLTDKQKQIADLWNEFNQMGFGIGKRSLTGLDVQDMPDTIRKYFLEGTKPKGAEWLKDGIPYLNNMANNYMDNASRLTVMLKAKADPSYLKSLGVDNIRDAIAKVMFDPSMMTDFEKNVMKKIIPFYTYAKNNLVYHLDNMGTNLGRYKKTLKGIKGLQDLATDGNSDDMADYLKNSLYIPIPGLGKNGEYKVLRASLPFGQLIELADNPLEELVNMSSIKTPFELASNKNFFTGREIEKFPGQKGNIDLLENIPYLNTAKGQYLLSNLSGFDVPIKTANRFLEGVKTGNYANPFVMSNNIDTDKLSKSYDQIQNLQNLMKQYEQKGYKFSTMSELKKANKNNTIAELDAIFAKYGVK